MPQPLAPGMPSQAAPQFYVTPRQRFSTGAILLAIAIAVAALFATVYALSHARHRYASDGSFHFGQSSDDNDDDDPSRMDTIYLGDPADAPVPSRPGSKPSSVHPFVVVHLPRSGNQTGQIPDIPSGRLLYAWLAAFNKGDVSALASALPSADADLAVAAQMELRKQTGGFTLLSAKEVTPGVLVFRMHDQTAAEGEMLGTLQMRADSFPPAIASFSLRAVAPVQTSPAIAR